jgi:hypothetical protein
LHPNYNLYLILYLPPWRIEHNFRGVEIDKDEGRGFTAEAYLGANQAIRLNKAALGESRHKEPNKQKKIVGGSNAELDGVQLLALGSFHTARSFPLRKVVLPACRAK